ncbi:amino acid ABC transporter ATP-binding protein [Microbacterium sp. 22242]|uniref:amino acid ABC transporter ATP-binding protein n=1 Tax=Microbacterium sp. 22242 TaxID=3453896 RepID=UPI003F835526
MNQPVVHARGVWKSFGENSVLRGIDFEVGKGEVVCIIGPSGSGKSTFLRCINHLERIDQGVIQVEGDYVGYEEKNGKLYEAKEKYLAAKRSTIGMVFQRFNLFPHMTVLENITEAPVLLRRLTKVQARQEANRLLESVGLAEKADAYPAMLSGGQQQRVAIARALAMSPALLLFDEPTSALDPELVGEVLAVMKTLAKEGRTMIVVTHEIGFAQEVADTLVVMDGGVIVETGPPRELVRNPQHERTAAFVSSLRSDNSHQGTP